MSERALSQEEVDALPDGAEVIVTWSGGNGPHRYTVGVDKLGIRYALLPPMGWREEAEPDRRLNYLSRLENCGDVCQDGKHRFTVVQLASPRPKAQDGDDGACNGEGDDGKP